MKMNCNPKSSFQANEAEIKNIYIHVQNGGNNKMKLYEKDYGGATI